MTLTQLLLQCNPFDSCDWTHDLIHVSVHQSYWFLTPLMCPCSGRSGNFFSRGAPQDFRWEIWKVLLQSKVISPSSASDAAFPRSPSDSPSSSPDHSHVSSKSRHHHTSSQLLSVGSPSKSGISPSKLESHEAVKSTKTDSSCKGSVSI